MLTIILVCPADRLPTCCQQVTDCRPTVGRQSANTLASNITQTVGRQLGNSRSTVGRQSADCCPTVGQQSADSWATVGRQLTDSRPTGFLGSSSSQLPTREPLQDNTRRLFYIYRLCIVDNSLSSQPKD